MTQGEFQHTARAAAATVAQCSAIYCSTEGSGRSGTSHCWPQLASQQSKNKPPASLPFQPPAPPPLTPPAAGLPPPCQTAPGAPQTGRAVLPHTRRGICQPARQTRQMPRRLQGQWEHHRHRPTARQHNSTARSRHSMVRRQRAMPEAQSLPARHQARQQQRGGSSSGLLTLVLGHLQRLSHHNLQRHRVWQEPQPAPVQRNGEAARREEGVGGRGWQAGCRLRHAAQKSSRQAPGMLSGTDASQKWEDAARLS